MPHHLSRVTKAVAGLADEPGPKVVADAAGLRMHRQASGTLFFRTVVGREGMVERLGGVVHAIVLGAVVRHDHAVFGAGQAATSAFGGLELKAHPARHAPVRLQRVNVRLRGGLAALLGRARGSQPRKH